MDTNEEQNRVSNLPLLFANGYPTSLDKITEEQLERFIPFMVQCSLGYINTHGAVEYSEPEWWPEDIPFTIPITRPKRFVGNWLAKMKEIVHICYDFHDSVFLLKFCSELARYEPASLRFMNNYTGTTSLFDRRCNKLLVTFRNENMTYDKPQTNRKCLLQQQKNRSQNNTDNGEHQMVEPALFDIYLCDNCDAELYSLEAINEHEKTCINDEVIICDSPTEDTASSTSDVYRIDDDDDEELQRNFLLNFNLKGQNIPMSQTHIKKVKANDSDYFKGDKQSSSVEKLKRLTRRNRSVHTLSRCPTIPISSPAGQLMLRGSKSAMSKDYLLERLDRMERFCHAPVLARGVSRPKFFDKRLFPQSHFTVNFKKHSDYTLRTYIFPLRHYKIKDYYKNFRFLNSILYKQCRPCSVVIKRLNECDWPKHRNNLNNNNPNFNIRLKREGLHSANWKIAPKMKSGPPIVIDTIDLCSSDEEDEKKCKNNSLNNSAIGGGVGIVGGQVGVSAKNCAKISALSNGIDDLHKTKSVEWNFLLSPTKVHSKPLRPSVSLFSNVVTTETLSQNTCPQKGIIGIKIIINNQENHVRSSIDLT